MITYYGTKTCMQCKATKRVMDKHGLAYTYINLDNRPELREQLRQEGWSTLPVVKGRKSSWAGFNPIKIEQETRA